MDPLAPRRLWEAFWPTLLFAGWVLFVGWGLVQAVPRPATEELRPVVSRRVLLVIEERFAP